VRKIVITSVGSLVGQNLLDALAGRADGFEIVGVNCDAAAAGNFRCDRAWLAPPAADRAAYAQRLAQILRDERPDLVLPGRDDDVVALADLKAAEPALAPALPVGPPELARILDDKWASGEYAHRHGLPYVDTVPLGDADGVERLVRRHGYPLIAKPRCGNGSRGVRIVFDERQRQRLSRDDEYLLQPYLEPEPDLPAWRELAAVGVPLFHAPVLQQLACQGVIGPDGTLRGLVCTMVELVMGRCERTWRTDDAGVREVARGYAEALAADGWVGAINLQGRRDGAGRYNVYELNGRFTGATTARIRLGFDEVGLLVEAFTGVRLPAPAAAGPQAIVTKSLADFSVEPAAIERLRADGCWQRAGTAERRR